MAAIRSSIAVLAVASILPVLAAEHLSGQTQAPQSDPAGLKLLHEMQTALGGAKAIAAVRDLEETIRAEASNEAR